MNDKYDNYDLSLQYANELLQRVLVEEITMKDAVTILINATSALPYKSMTKDEVDETYDKHSEYIYSLISASNDYIKKNRLTKKEFALLVTTTMNSLLSDNN